MSASDKEVNYSVVFMGEIITGFDKQQVIHNLSNITRLPEAQVEEKFFNQGTTRLIIKKPLIWLKPVGIMVSFYERVWRLVFRWILKMLNRKAKFKSLFSGANTCRVG